VSLKASLGMKLWWSMA